MALWTPAELGSTAFRLGLRAMDTDGLNAGAEITRVGSAVSQWSDWSGNANHFTQATSGARPTYSSSLTELGSKPGVVWDGSDDFLGATVNYFGSGLTVFTVLMTGDYKGSIYEQGPSGFNEDFNFINFDRYWRAINDNNATNQAEFLSEDFTNPHIYAASMTSALRAIYIDGYTRASNTTSQTLSSTSGITRLGMTLWDGEASSMSVGEYVVIEGTLLQADREKIEGYLAWKWGLQGNLDAAHPYKSAAPTTGGGGTAYTLTAALGTFALAGQASLRGLSMAAGAGSFALTGIAANLVSTPLGTVAYTLTADVGTFALAGQASLRKLSMASGAGAFALAGQAATLTYATPATTNYVLTAAPGAYTVSGQAANLLPNLAAAPVTAYFAITERPDTIEMRGEAVQYPLSWQWLSNGAEIPGQTSIRFTGGPAYYGTQVSVRTTATKIVYGEPYTTSVTSVPVLYNG